MLAIVVLSSVNQTWWRRPKSLRAGIPALRNAASFETLEGKSILTKNSGFELQKPSEIGATYWIVRLIFCIRNLSCNGFGYENLPTG